MKSSPVKVWKWRTFERRAMMQIVYLIAGVMLYMVLGLMQLVVLLSLVRLMLPVM